MTKYSEKRKFMRYEYETPRVMFKKDSKQEYNYAVMTNYGAGGMYIKTNEYMDIGQAVIIKMEDYDPDSTGPEKYDYYYGQVRWIKNFHTKTYDSSYGYGVQYDKAVYYA